MTFRQSFGLALLILSVAVADGVLLYDAILWLCHIRTISGGTWIALELWRDGQGPFPYWSLVLVGWLCLPPIGLALHFWDHATVVKLRQKILDAFKK